MSGADPAADPSADPSAGAARPSPEDAGARLRAVHAELLARTPESAVQPRLQPVREALSLLGDPHLAHPVVHVAGTNGKTSTARFAERLLRELGLRTGRFTSPHLTRVPERISVDGEPLSDEAFADLHEDVAPYLAMVDGRLRAAGQVPLTYFEALAVMAFAAFADAPVDVAVVEVGLGGRWDATNVVDAAVAVITPVSLDHTELLGETVAEIAAEKAGIIARGAVAVLARQPVEAAEVLLRRAAEQGATVAREGLEFGVRSREVAVGGQVLALQGLAGTVYEDVLLPVFGAHQASNAAVAVAAVEALLGGQGLDPDVVRAALADASSPGRLEVVRRSPTVLVDAAHNPAGAEALVAALEDSFDCTRLVGVVAVLEGKDAAGILDVLEPALEEVVVTRSASPRAMDVDDLAEVARDVFGEDRVHVAPRLDDALQVAVDRAESEAPGGLGAGVVVTGSVTLVGEARVLLRADR
ncbi:folylpolyglutamate synthase/dihydrofolate synthase family protein [Quadrisphaera sp. DSM 44207]|uniref:bifunctional folylpolyglutamate synthase/dihydrofolate synthase n=1 Tax=Quadrisphaera sp. DSM 44207 TaxID=1881057 RepID=UPI000887BD77|nr:folylpolyglutamate synthase/dihydrofolate synthase family protein [Quadrisphaera sp. DSM 44207]SDQ05538.1 dihydrofolate synthase / folylpolyglutamate synthase [Quadrisphaera sp. DSM 44207]